MSETTTPNPPIRWALSVDETAAALGVSRAHAYRMVRAGVLPSLRVGGRIIVPVGMLRRLLVDGRLGGTVGSAARRRGQTHRR